ncbi:inositol monophosphatase [Candidatus Kaiserbacteria bacterium RIFCSPLOWO2_01_FULL_55_19]|uniref:Probable inosine/xanthosine triphosphatase n=1 Tax=Candidatus Kaiserbacteria bacterium RIFCSPLOWO2_01_FULL_55_19 TaxID=1798516 RepID=A0A1F6ERM2_9BACT|nr:MAG: inositol monophosphatase [Candidatus Kaiserbacteria bacterium RIFCSPLOWO2_01_FULL_55_19]
MKKIIVASKNPVKIAAALSGFQKMFPHETFEVEGVSAPSGVGEQPRNDTETFTGARNRAQNASKEVITADYWVGIEGGIEEKNSAMEAFAWVVIQAKGGAYGKGRTGTFFLPPKIAELIQQGKELGEADDIVFGRSNSKQGNGAVGILTGDVVDRTKYYTEAVVFALIPFKNIELY